MNENPFREKIHSSLHFIALAGTAAGLTFSKAVMSLALVLGFVNLLAQGHFKTYFTRLRASRPFHLIALLFILHAVGILWSQDWNYGLNDLRIKLPLIVLPLLIFAQPPNQQQILRLLYLFVAGIVLTTFVNYMAYNGIIGSHQYDDIRGLSLFGSHIRFGLLVALATVICLYFLVKHDRFKALHFMLFIWLLYYTYFSQIISGNLALMTGILAFVFALIYPKNKKAAFAFISLSVILPILILTAFFIKPNERIEVNAEDLEKETAEGNLYSHDFVEHRDTKGNLLYINVCDKELEREWAKRSSLAFEGNDLKDQPIRTTLIRYMTSKGLKKDAAGFKQLTKEDLRNIERGIAEAEDGKRGLSARFNGIKYQLQNNSNPNGHSLLQRMEHWKTGWHILRSNWIFGVGTGDVQLAFDKQYDLDESLLTTQNRNRAHNQFITMWISFGLFGLVLFVYLIWNYLSLTLRKGQLLGFIFMLIACSSFLLEDTLETQTGVTFFAFFYSLMIFFEDKVILRS
jgi:hypothetical protein